MGLVNVGHITVPDSDMSMENTSLELTIDATGEKVAFICQVPKSGNIAKVAFRTHSFTQCTNGLTIGIQTVDASGDPSGSAYGGMVAVTGQAVAATTWYTVTLATPATAIQGDVIAVVIEFTTFDTGDSLSIRTEGIAGHNLTRVAYCNLFTASWAPDTGGKVPLVALEYSDGSYEVVAGCLPVVNSVESYSSATDPDERGIRFQLTHGARVKGCWLTADIDAGEDFDMVLYPDSGAALETLSWDGDHTSRDRYGWYYLTFASAQTLNADTWYRLALKPGASAINLIVGEAPSAAAMGGLPLGANCYKSTRNNGGAWTDSGTTLRPMMGLIIDQIETGGGATLAPNIGFPFARQR